MLNLLHCFSGSVTLELILDMLVFDTVVTNNCYLIRGIVNINNSNNQKVDRTDATLLLLIKNNWKGQLIGVIIDLYLCLKVKGLLK